MKIGKLYKNNEYFWLLYPSKDIAAAADAVGLPIWFAANRFAVGAPPHAAHPARDPRLARHVAYYSKHFKCNVSYIEPNSIFCLLEQDGEYIKVLSTNGELGWMIYPTNEPWTRGCIEEVNQ
jgi:hypothetical protein